MTALIPARLMIVVEPPPGHPRGFFLSLEHDPEKWAPVFQKRSCSNKKLERDDDSKKSHHALVMANLVSVNSRAASLYWSSQIPDCEAVDMLRINPVVAALAIGGGCSSARFVR